MKKAFSLLELILVVTLISIISIFAISKFWDKNDYINFTKLKSDYTIIKTKISSYKSKKILLSQSNELESLDNAKIDKKNEKLFTNILDFDIYSTSTEANEEAKWIKISDKSYEFILNSVTKVSFLLKDNSFICKDSIKICGELQ